MGITAFLADDVELIEKENARCSSCKREQLTEPLCRLTEKTANQRLVTHREEWDTDGFRNCLCKSGLAVSRRTAQQHTMAWLKTM